MIESLAHTPGGHRKDRLVALITMLRDGDVHRGADLALALAISERTLYRDMQVLTRSGVPIKGTRGTGYQMTEQVTLPALNLTLQELEALHLGLAVMTEAADADLRLNARQLAAKIDAALPETGSTQATGWGLETHPFADTSAGVKHVPVIRAAIRGQNDLALTYLQDSGEISNALMTPLKLEFWGRIWTATMWNETEQKPQLLRLDRIQSIAGNT
ncbi:MAG: HTH domain-containing protein [Paracoccaceae bacterium]